MKIEQLEISIYRIPTDRPEADGTFQWDSTTLVLVETIADSGLRGLAFSYTAAAAGELIRERLVEAVISRPVEHIGAAWEAMVRAVRNVGQPGVAATAISAVDISLWDLRARAARMPLFQLLGVYRERVPLYGSGGFTTYGESDLVEQLAGWVEEGISRVKMKVGKDWGTKPDEDLAKVSPTLKNRFPSISSTNWHLSASTRRSLSLPGSMAITRMISAMRWKLEPSIFFRRMPHAAWVLPVVSRLSPWHTPMVCLFLHTPRTPSTLISAALFPRFHIWNTSTIM